MPADYWLVTNHHHLIALYGEWPSFHDAEVLSLTLDRNGPTLELRLYMYELRENPYEEATKVRAREIEVLFHFTGIRDAKLFDFNGQNVLAELTFEKQPEGLRISLHTLNGLYGTFLCDLCEIARLSQADSHEHSSE